MQYIKLVELKGQDRANYGKEIIKKISKELADEYGKGFDSRNLYDFLNFYKTFPNILNAVSSKSNALLSWTHYRTLLQVLDKDVRDWYEKEALSQTWSARTLQRNISSQYYYRLLKSQIKEPVIDEMKKVNENQYLINKLEFVKNPVIAEFLGYSLDDSFTETELESSIINNLQKFLMELRKRICFCCKTTTYSYRKRRLLYKFGILQLLYLPTEDELRAEIENQKTIFELQQQNKQDLDNNQFLQKIQNYSRQKMNNIVKFKIYKKTNNDVDNVAILSPNKKY